MQLTPNRSAYTFLQGGGEMGHLTRSYNWAQTSLGNPDVWPQSLRTTLSIILNSKFPMFLFWGEELICFYNDAYRPSLGNNGKHPDALGKTGAEIWPEIWDVIKPLIDQVLSGGEASWSEDQLIPIYRNGTLEDVYWTFSYSPVCDESGKPAGVFVTCTETTEKIKNFKQLEESKNQLEFAIEATELGTWDLIPTTNKFTANARLKEWFGLLPEEEVELTLALSVIAERDRQRVASAIQYALQYASGGHYDIEYTIVHPLTKKERLVRAKGRSWFTDDKLAYRFNGTLQDITEQKKAEEEKQKLIAIIEASNEFVSLATPDAFGQYVNPAGLKMLGWDTVEGKRIQDCVYPEDQVLAEKLVAQLIQKGHFSHEIRFVNARTNEPFWLQWNGIALKDATTNEITGLATVSPNITERKKTEQSLRESEGRFRSLIEKAPVAVAVYGTRELIIETANDAMIRLWGKTPSVIGTKLADALPELEGQPFIGLLEQVYDTAIPYQTNEQQTNLVVDGRLQAYWFTFTYQPLTTDQGDVYAILNMAVDVTERVVARQRIEESRRQLLTSFEQSPVAIAIIDKTDLTFRMANPFYSQLVGRTPDELIGKPMLEALPELRGQGFDELLKAVIATGIPYVANEVAADIIRNNQLETIYVDLNYQPQREADERISGALVVATDVTKQVLARKKIEDAEATLRGAIELAELATWSLDIEKGTITYSERFMEWLGFSENTKDLDAAYNPLPDEYRQSVIDAIAAVIKPDSSGIYENEHPIVNRLTGQIRIIHAQAQVFYDSAGKPAFLSGTAQDLTKQRKLQQELEGQVEQRTQQLQASVHDLQRSNENLQQFAYIASHDLQEPLRKIQSFGDLLKNQYADQLGEGIDHLLRVQAAASRMSALIKDLLSYSRISTHQDATAPVSLTEVVQTVLTDLDLVINETNAQVDVGLLPTVQGDKSQLGQLFQNLLSNALKFRRTDPASVLIGPVIRVSTQSVAAIDLPMSIRPTRLVKAYHRIDVTDNGIGFEEKYIDRIFQVFQRLHGRNEYAGTGIGLAICEKVAANHGGAITAISRLGEGATFSVYLPM